MFGTCSPSLEGDRSPDWVWYSEGGELLYNGTILPSCSKSRVPIVPVICYMCYKSTVQYCASILLASGQLCARPGKSRYWSRTSCWSSPVIDPTHVTTLHNHSRLWGDRHGPPGRGDDGGCTGEDCESLSAGSEVW